jgi:uncharacterized protein
MPDDATNPVTPSTVRGAVPRRRERAWVDYGHEIRMHRNPLLRVAYLGLGWLCVVSGAIGVVLPGWPTTIWIILATYFFARSSPRFYNWLMNHRVFGPLVRDWRDGKGMTARAKRMAVGTIVVTIGISIAVVPYAWLRVLLVVVAVSVSTYLLRLPTKPDDGGADHDERRRPAS